jgi:plasmid stabilization system protein ParE
MVKIVWTKKSLKDLKMIFDFIKLDSPFYASRFIEKLVIRTDQLLHFPE